MVHATNNASMDSLIRSEIWSSQLKEVLEDELQAMGWVNWITEFPDGDQFTIPSIGQAKVDDYVEGAAIQYRNLATGEFQFNIDQYLVSAHSITDKAKEDSFYMSQLVSSFVPSQARAIMERVEADILNLQSAQTASNLNTINGFDHRFVANGTSNVIALTDFAYANLALTKANVPAANRIAIVDPTVAYELETQTNLVNVSNNARWEGVIENGLTQGMKFIKNVYGFDVFESNYCADIASETIDSVAVTNGKANLFFSAAPDVMPFIGAWRRMPEVEMHRAPDYQEDRFITSARYGLGLFRPENLVTIISDSTQASS